MLREGFCSVLAGVLAAAVLVPAAAPARPMSTIRAIVPCAQTTIAARKAPTGSAQYESGVLTLANGASLRLQGSPAEMRRARSMVVGDPVAACYGPLKRYADAGPSRTITVLDLANGEYYASLIGTWKPR